jgi:hypothetical protein
VEKTRGTGGKMVTKEIQKRNEKAQNLRVLQADGSFFVESQEGAILYKVNPDGNGKFSCTCGDYAKGVKNDFLFQCKHILSVLHCVPNKEVEDAEFLEKKKAKLDERFIKTIEGRDFVLYSGLLDLAHQKGLLKIEVDPLQFPTKENGYFAICKAMATSKFGEIFVDVGDANPTNCNAKVSKHLLRMASTRAKARALRDMDDIGMTCLEELGDLDEVLGEEASEQGKSRKPIPKKSATPTEPKGGGEPKPQKGNGSNGGNGSSAIPKSDGSKPQEARPTPKPESKPEEAKPKPKPETKADAPQMSSAQKKAIYNLSRRRGISVEQLEKMAQESYGVPLESLSAANASAFIPTLQQSA